MKQRETIRNTKRLDVSLLCITVAKGAQSHQEEWCLSCLGKPGECLLPW